MALSIAGVPLEGNRLVRLTYLDDSGLFNEKHDPFLVIGGVIIDADRQLVAVEDHIEELVRKHIPEKDWDGFVFHATELWSGSKYFDRVNWSREKRLLILQDLAMIPSKFDLLVTLGFQDRKLLKPPSHWDLKTKELSAHIDVFARFCETVERYMREFAPDEVTLLIFEDRDTIREITKHAHAMFRDSNRVSAFGSNLYYFPFSKIRDTIHFARKKESRHLQVADACTFIIKKALMKDKIIWPFYQLIKPQMLVIPTPLDRWEQVS